MGLFGKFRLLALKPTTNYILMPRVVALRLLLHTIKHRLPPFMIHLSDSLSSQLNHDDVASSDIPRCHLGRFCSRDREVASDV